MQPSKIITIPGLNIDLSRIKAIKLNTNTGIGPVNILTIDLNTRYQYVFNPNKNKYQKHKIKDSVYVEYIDYNEAFENAEHLSELWQVYLNEIQTS